MISPLNNESQEDSCHTALCSLLFDLRSAEPPTLDSTEGTERAAIATKVQIARWAESIEALKAADRSKVLTKVPTWTHSTPMSNCFWPLWQ